MSSAFFGLQIGRSALLTNQLSIDTAGHNLSNVETEGYSRQRVNVEQVSVIGSSSVTQGGGVRTAGIERIHETYLERQLSRLQTQTAYDSEMVTGLDQLQTVLGEPSDSGINAALSEFWNSWESLSLNPTDTGIRGQVVEAAQQLATRYNDRIQGLRTAEMSFNGELDSAISEANELMAKVAELNLSVAKAQSSGQPANDLSDQLDTAAREVGKLLGVEPEYDGSYVNLKLPNGGPYLVYRGEAYALTTQKDSSGMITAVTVDNTYPLEITSGEIGAYFTLRDEVSVGLRDQLNELMSRVTDRVNELQDSGYDAQLRPGQNLFTWSGLAETVQIYPSSGLSTVGIGTALQAGTHHLEVVSVDQAVPGVGLVANDYGTLTAGLITLAQDTTAGGYTGENTLNLDYNVRVLSANAATGDLGGMRVQLFKGETAVSDAVTLAAGAGPQTVSFTADGMTLNATIDLGGDAFFNAAERSNGLATTGTVSLDGGVAVAVDHAGSFRYNFVGGTDNNFRGGGASSVEFTQQAFSGSSFTVSSNTGSVGISATILADLGRLAAAAPNAAGLGTGDGENARLIANLATEVMFEYTNETAAGRLGRVVQELGERGREAQTFETASAAILTQLDAQKQSVSGVNMDEEMVLLIQYQRGFEAAARFVNTSDDLLDVIINRLGRVGL